MEEDAGGKKKGEAGEGAGGKKKGEAVDVRVSWWGDKVAGEIPSAPSQDATPLAESASSSSAVGPTRVAAEGKSPVGAQSQRRASETEGYLNSSTAHQVDHLLQAFPSPHGATPSARKHISPRRDISPIRRPVSTTTQSLSPSSRALSHSLGQLPPAWKGGGAGTTPGTPRSVKSARRSVEKPISRTGPAAGQLAAVKVLLYISRELNQKLSGNEVYYNITSKEHAV